MYGQYVIYSQLKDQVAFTNSSCKNINSSLNLKYNFNDHFIEVVVFRTKSYFN